MDDIDKWLLDLLSENARTSITALAKTTGKARTTIQTRIERLERTGVIAGYALRLGSEASELQVKATVLIQFDPTHSVKILRQLQSFPEVKKIITLSGRFDAMVNLSVRSTAKLDETLERIGEIDGLHSTESLIHLRTKLDREAF